MRGKAHSDETKAAVMAALMAGQGVSQVAKEFGLPDATVREWGKGAQFAEVRAKKGERIEELTFNYLGALLDSLTKQAQVVSGKDYISKQPASEIAVLHGVMADKAFRLLSALPAGNEPAQQSNGPAEAGAEAAGPGSE